MGLILGILASLSLLSSVITIYTTGFHEGFQEIIFQRVSAILYMVIYIAYYKD